MVSMKCRKCPERAVIRMRQHKLALCKAHYLEWILSQTERFIKKYKLFSHDDRILVAVSGGKDSLALWDVLSRLGYSAEGLYINLGIQGAVDYSNESERRTQLFSKQNGLNLHTINIEDQYGSNVPTTAFRYNRTREKPCSVCGLIKRHTMNRMAYDLGFSVLATAHNLDDETAFLLSNTLDWNLSLLRRQSPVLPKEEGFVKKVKPFFRFTEREIAAYTILQNIDYIEDECPFSEGSKQVFHKTILNKIEEEEPGAKLRFLLGLLKAREDGRFPLFETGYEDVELRPCPSCGQPTSRNDLCAFCKLMETNTNN
jgi:uncharacterized protein (TIGR00269 family)